LESEQVYGCDGSRMGSTMVVCVLYMACDR
jgi:hypothetical protein